MVTILLRRQSCSQGPSNRSSPRPPHEGVQPGLPRECTKLGPGEGSPHRGQWKGFENSVNVAGFPFLGQQREVHLHLQKVSKVTPAHTALVSAASSRAGQGLRRNPVSHLGAAVAAAK